MKPLHKYLAAGTALLLSATVAHSAFAATDGTLGATSTGTSVVSVTIDQMYQISGMADFALGTYGGTGDLTGSDDVCIYTNDAAATYNVTITDNSTLSAADFSVENAGDTADIPFTVSWNDVSGTVGQVAATYATPLASTGANTASTNCGGGNNANLAVNILEADLQAAAADSYSSTLSVLIEP